MMLRRPSLLRHVLRSSLQALGILSLTLLLTELAFRLVHAIEPIYIFPTESYNRFRAKPGSIRFGVPVNSQGFVDVDFEPSKPPGGYRILGLGDSFVYSIVPYEDNFLTLLEEGLRQGRPQIEVFNMGIPRTDLEDYFTLFRKEGLRLAPDLVVVHFYIGNDFRIGRKKDEDPPLFVMAFLRYLFRISPEITRELKAHVYSDDRPSLGPEAYARILRNRMSIFQESKTRYHMAGIRDNLIKFRETCRSHDSRLLVVILPDELQVDVKLRKEVMTANPDLKPKNYDFGLPNRTLHQELDGLGIEWFDLRETFTKVARKELLYKPRNTHWNRRGNRLAATAIERHLLSTGWLPPRIPGDK